MLKRISNIGYSYVGELAEFDDCTLEDTPDGMRFCRPILVKELQNRGHQIFSLQKRLEKKPFNNVNYDDVGFPNLDVLFVEWRWPTYKGDTYDLKRQTELLQKYHGQIPIILYDASYKIEAKDEDEYPKAIIADPGIEPRFLSRERERLLFWSDFKELLFEPLVNEFRTYGYVGNDYERRESVKKYYASCANDLRTAGVQTVLYGNWLKMNAERNSVDDFLRNKQFSNVYFAGRWSFKDSMKAQSKFIATTHMAKDIYYEKGNITVRFFDSFATNTIGLVPVEYLCRDILGDKWIVSTPYDVYTKVKQIASLTLEQRREVVQEQAYELQAQYPETNVKSTANFIESFIK